MNYPYESLETLPSRIADQLAGDIDRNKFAPGDRLPGDRQLAELYNIGRSSMIAALQILQKKGYIDRIPMRGTFVCKDVRKVTKELQLFFPLPLIDQTLFEQAFPNMVTLSEMMQGLSFSGIEKNYTVTFRYLPESSDPMELRRQMEFIQAHFNGVVFTGHQFQHLQEQVFQLQMPAVNVHPMPLWGRTSLPSIGYDDEAALEQYAEYLGKTGGRSVEIFSAVLEYREDQRGLDMRLGSFRKALEALGIAVTEHVFPRDILQSEKDCLDQIGKILDQKNHPADVLCGVSYQILMMLQNVIAMKQIHPKIIALTGNGVFSMFHPSVAYLRIPFFEMGQCASEMLVENIRTGKPLENRLIQPGIWIGEQKHH